MVATLPVFLTHGVIHDDGLLITMSWWVTSCNADDSLSPIHINTPETAHTPNKCTRTADGQPQELGEQIKILTQKVQSEMRNVDIQHHTVEQLAQKP